MSHKGPFCRAFFFYHWRDLGSLNDQKIVYEIPLLPIDMDRIYMSLELPLALAPWLILEKGGLELL